MKEKINTKRDLFKKYQKNPINHPLTSLFEPFLQQIVEPVYEHGVHIPDDFEQKCDKHQLAQDPLDLD